MIQADTIDRILGMKGDGLPFVSLYVDVNAERRRGLGSQLASLLDQIRPLAYDGSLEHDARLSVRNDIGRIQRAAAEERWRPGAVGIFACAGRGVFEQVHLPHGVHNRVVVDETPWVRPLLAVLDRYHRSCIVVIDKGSARLWELYQDEMRQTSSFRDPTLRKPNFAAGFAEHRMHNRAEELANRHYRRVVEMVDQAFRTDPYEVLIIGGHDHELPGFVDLLPHHLRGLVAGTFTLDPGTATIGDIKRSADSVLEKYERDEEQRLVAEVLGADSAQGMAAIGLARCLWAGSVGAVQSLLVQDDAFAAGVVCDESGWLGLSGETCPLCGGRTRNTSDVVNELVSAVIGHGGVVEHVVSETPLMRHRVAAKLRFSLPPLPPT